MANKENKHVFITLGLKLNNEGHLENEAIGRLKKTVEAYNQQKDSYIIVSGGNPKSHKTEAKAMKNWLVRKGVPQYRIIEENKSKDTVENAINSMNIVNKEKFQSVTLITSDIHMKRALILFKKMDYHNKLISNIGFITKKNINPNQEDKLIESNLKELDKRTKKYQNDT